GGRAPAVRGRVLGVAHPWLHLRPGEDRAADRVVRDRNLRLRAADASAEQVLADGEPVDDAEVAAVGALGEGTADVPPADVDLRRRGRARSDDLDEGVTGGDQIGAVREYPDRDRRGRGRGARYSQDGDDGDKQAPDAHRSVNVPVTAKAKRLLPASGAGGYGLARDLFGRAERLS